MTGNKEGVQFMCIQKKRHNMKKNSLNVLEYTFEV